MNHILVYETLFFVPRVQKNSCYNLGHTRRLQHIPDSLQLILSPPKTHLCKILHHVDVFLIESKYLEWKIKRYVADLPAVEYNVPG